ncbi:hypothetical protein KUTeg_015459 [Tegillarca granosa]|uniref:OTU domain-containing protein n=1 Tax=Tegillarca granosa TaxID=220873 RepID=A0ABQ9EUN0_TEGGR|nr:hypothetical protein KUTeg_015459 [Tegillarca granosa]
MQTHAELVYGNGQEFESDLILRLESPFEGTYILKTPFAGIENTKATFNYEFVNNRIQTHSEFIYGNQQRIESDVVLRVESPFEGSFTLRTPFVGFEEIASSFTHESSETSLKTHAEINYAAQKKIETDVNFSLNDRIDGSISFKTPFRHFEALSASFRHSGGSNGLKSYGEISYGPQKKIEADLSYTKEPQLEGSIVIKTPFRGMEQVIASARHNIRNNNIESHAEINFATRKFEADINASKYPLQGRIAVKTPFSGFEDIEYLLQQEKTSEMLKLHSELIYGQDKVEDIFSQINHSGHTKSSNDTQKILMETLKEQGMRVRGSIPKDGNCFFHAVVDQLKRLDMPQQNLNHLQLRSQVVWYLKNLPKVTVIALMSLILERKNIIGNIILNNDCYVEEQLKDVEECVEGSLDDYLLRMERDGEFADHVIIEFTAKYLQREILIVTSSPQSKNAKRENIIINTEDAKNGCQLLLGHVYENHYESLEMKDEAELES